MTEATTPENQETVQISDMTQFIAILTAWHKKRVDELIYYSTIPDGGHIGVILSDENGADVEHVLQGDTLKGFKAGINVALVALGKLPFIFEMEAAPEASETPPAAPALVGDEQADAYLTEPGRLESLARSHPAGLVRALARAMLAAAPQAPAAPSSVAGDWDGKLPEQLQRALNALRLECPPAVVADVEHEVRSCYEALHTSLATTRRMYGAARDRLEALDAAQPDPFAPALEAPAAPVVAEPANLPHHPV